MVSIAPEKKNKEKKVKFLMDIENKKINVYICRNEKWEGIGKKSKGDERKLEGRADIRRENFSIIFIHFIYGSVSLI